MIPDLPTSDQRLATRERLQQAVVMYQRWEKLLFLHWRWDATEVQKRLPQGLYVDTFEGDAWVGVVPFYMRRIRPRFTPAVRGISDFLELNVRTYVHDGKGRPGVWFFSLDCNQPLAVWTARALFRLPYRHAVMTAAETAEGMVHYTSRLKNAASASEFKYRLEPASTFAEPGTLEFFLAERYLLFAQTRRGLRCGRVYHTPYPLSAVTLGKWTDQPLLENQFASPGRPPDHVVGASAVSVNIHGLTL